MLIAMLITMLNLNGNYNRLQVSYWKYFRSSLKRSKAPIQINPINITETVQITLSSIIILNRNNYLQ